MSHPFELELSDLKAVELGVEEQLTDEEVEKVKGGIRVTTFHATLCVGEAGEEGGGGPPIATTNYITAEQGEAGEEGGGLSL